MDLASTSFASTSYVTQSGKFAFTFDDSGELIPEHVNRTGGGPAPPPPGTSTQSPEDMEESVYSDAGDTFASPSFNGLEDHDAAAAAGPQRPAVDSRDFIMRRFLPAAQALVSTSATTSPLPPDPRLARDAEDAVAAGRGAAAAPLAIKSRFASEAERRDGGGDDGDEKRACGFPLRLGRMTFRNLRYGFGTARSGGGGGSKSPQHAAPKINGAPKKGLDGGCGSEHPDWSDEASPDSGIPSQEISEYAKPGGGGDMVAEVDDFLELTPEEGQRGHAVEAACPAEGGFGRAQRRPPARLASIHTRDHRGFLGLPKPAGLPSGEAERARQVDRLGARLAHLISKVNYVEHRGPPGRMDGRGEEGMNVGAGGALPPPAAGAPGLPNGGAKWADQAALMPPPPPKSPSESWLCNTLPPSRFAEAKKLAARKPLGGYGRIRRLPSKRPTREEAPSRMRRPVCSVNENFQGRHVFSSTAQAV